ADVKLHERFLADIEDPDVRRAKREATVRLFRMVDRGGCRHRAILAHFDEALEACGESCDVCTGVTVEDMVATAKQERRRKAIAEGRSAVTTSTTDSPLFQELRTIRKRLADEEGVPAYVIFNDRTLVEMVAR